MNDQHTESSTVCFPEGARCNNLILVSQPQGQNLDKIVVSVPLTPAHGAVAQLQSQVTATSERLRSLKRD